MKSKLWSLITAALSMAAGNQIIIKRQASPRSQFVTRSENEAIRVAEMKRQRRAVRNKRGLKWRRKAEKAARNSNTI